MSTPNTTQKCSPITGKKEEDASGGGGIRGFGRRNAPNGRELSPRAPRFAAGLFTELGGDVVAFGVEESTYRFRAPAT